MTQDFNYWLALASHVGVAGAEPAPMWNEPCAMTPRQWARHVHAQKVEAAKQRRAAYAKPARNHPLSNCVITPAEVGFTQDKEVDFLNGAIVQLHADAHAALSKYAPAGSDVNSTYSNPPTGPGTALAKLQPASPVLTALVDSIDNLTNEWGAWVKDGDSIFTQVVTPRPIFGDAAMTGFKLRYAAAYDNLIRLGEKTSAPKVGPGSKAGGSGFSVPWWVWPVGLAALAIVFVGPTVAPILLAGASKKAAAGALAVI